MKYHKKKNFLLPLLVVVLAVVLVVLLVAVTRQSGGQPNPNGDWRPGTVTDPTQETHGEAPGTTDAPTQPTLAGMRIETPYGDLYFPEEWSGLIQVAQVPGDPYQVVFTAHLDSGIQQELFSILFGGSMDGALGAVKVDGEEVYVRLSIQEIQPGADWTDNDISILYAMQECLNDVLAGLNLTTPQADPQPNLPADNGENMVIDSPIGDLYYPARWKDYLKLDVSQTGAYTMKFCAQLDGFDPVHLFTVYLDSASGIPVTDITTSDGSVVKVSVDIAKIEADINWTDAQKAIVLAMQEDINILLAGLN